jgi:hypothetical protein
MPWTNPHTHPLTRLAVAAHVPSESGVFAISADAQCLLVGATWNLKARLLDLVNLLPHDTEFQVTYELCVETECEQRKSLLGRELLRNRPAEIAPELKALPGLSFWEYVERPMA